MSAGRHVQHLAARPLHAAVVARRLGLRADVVVRDAAVEVGKGGRDARVELLEVRVACLDGKDADGRVFGQASGDDGAGGAGAWNSGARYQARDGDDNPVGGEAA